MNESAPVSRGSSSAQLGMFERRGEAVPLVDLAELLSLAHDASVPRKALVVRRNGQPVAFVLDRVIGQQEAVVRPLVDPLVHVPGISGATDLGDGRPTLVLDLIALATARPATSLRAAELPLRSSVVPRLGEGGGGERRL